MRATIDFLLNGERVSLDAAHGTRTLLAWLREARSLTGTKEGCAEGDCGACTVVVDDLPVCSCIYPLGCLDGKALTTVEGLENHPAQRAMVECHGSQCGFCTPGFVMALYAHYQNPAAPLADALAGNLCRCTGYAPILEAGRKMFEYQSAKQGARSPAPEEGVFHPRFSAPRTLAELERVLRPGATLLAGGTDLGLFITKQLRELDNVVYLGNVRELKRIEDKGDHIEIGAAVTYAEAFKALGALHPDIGELLRRLGGAQVRACGTLAGNIANGSPIGDSMPFLMALGAIVLTSRRAIALEDFYIGYRKSVLDAGEYIRAVRVPKLSRGARFAVYKVSKRFDQDISAVCGAFHVHEGKARFAFGGMAATPARARRAEAAFAQGADAACAALTADFNPLSDHRGSGWYRMAVAQNLLRKFAAATSPRAIFEL
jgi:xanthine dehydrogenase small subunit